ncbi:MAG TPA: hypothetical protein VFA94_14695 [Acidimicrobiales bacterium]|nr:hypothetical protein [Acidimicrobiales bacterium]
MNNAVNYPTYHATDIELIPPKRTGYWILGSNGGVYAYPNPGAPFYGSAAPYLCAGCNTPAMAPDPDGTAYWILGSDGGIFAFPSPGAPFYGSANGSFPPGAYGTGIAAKPDGSGYWIINNLGQVYSYPVGSSWYGGGIPAGSQPARSIKSTTSGHGYWIAGNDGTVYAFGDAAAIGATGIGNTIQMGRDPISNRVVTIATDGRTAPALGETNYGQGTGGTFDAIAVAGVPSPPNLSASSSPQAVTFARGSSGSTTLTVASNDTYWANTTWSVSGVPSGVSASIVPQSYILPASSSRQSMLTFSAPLTYTGAPTFVATATACGQGICSSTTISVVVSLT